MKYIAALLLVVVAFNLSGCGTWSGSAPPAGGHYSGTLFLNFEESAFVPSGSLERWWFEGDIYKELEKIAIEEGRATGTILYGKYEIDFEGRLELNGNYGHLGGYRIKVICDTLIDLALIGESSLNEPQE